MKDQVENKGNIDKEVKAETEIGAGEASNDMMIVMKVHAEGKIKAKRKRQEDSIPEIEAIVPIEVKTKTKIFTDNHLGVKVRERSIKSTTKKKKFDNKS